MTARSLSDTIGRRLWATGIVLALTSGLVAALYLTSGPSPANAAGTQAASMGTADRDDLKDDLSKARELEGDERRDALRSIRSAAADGEYGDTIEQRLGKRSDRRAAVLAFLPDALRTDLEKIRDAEPDQRKEMVEDIRDKALDGGYGPEAQEAAETMQEHWKDGRPMAGRAGPFGLR